ncbi:hypothetical protein HNY73_010283 [Argiope bruennichi]|uniref:Uncharacterized protein n=1 Tax=Argiope bruennichi TaxID=94029 RepID=A0A8T0F2D9_ARGBR|nr:hypothetical protein HNY73_010283 [Argiope bruennichi]
MLKRALTWLATSLGDVSPQVGRNISSPDQVSTTTNNSSISVRCVRETGAKGDFAEISAPVSACGSDSPIFLTALLGPTGSVIALRFHSKSFI